MIKKEIIMASTGGVKLGSDFDEARTRKMNAEAELAELQLATVHGTLVVADDVVTAWDDVLGALKTKLLSLPSKGAPVLSTETDPNVCQNILTDLINETLEELSNYDPKVSADKANIDKSDAPTAPKKRGRPSKIAKLKQ
jgi:hypothetical protein